MSKDDVKVFKISKSDRDLYVKYAMEEQDNPEPTEEDIQASIRESVEVAHGSLNLALRSMRRWYRVDQCECPLCEQNRGERV